MVPLYYLEKEIKDKQAFSDVTNDIRREAFFEPKAYKAHCEVTSEGRALAIAFSDDSLAMFIHKGYAVVFLEADTFSGVAKDTAACNGCADWGLRAFADAILLDINGANSRWLRGIYERHYGIPWHILDTKRTIVREAANDDIDALYELYAAPGITDYLEPLYEREKEEQYQRDYQKNIYDFYGYGMWLVFDKISGKLIGRCGIDPHEYGPELGYMIHPDFQRKGIAYEVCLAIIGYAREELDISKLYLSTCAGNTASVALAKKLGFISIGNDMYELNL